MNYFEYHFFSFFNYFSRSVSGGELYERVVAKDFTLTERDGVLFTRQICEGVRYMHGHDIVHLDLKVGNAGMTVCAHSRNGKNVSGDKLFVVLWQNVKKTHVLYDFQLLPGRQCRYGQNRDLITIGRIENIYSNPLNMLVMPLDCVL